MYDILTTAGSPDFTYIGVQDVGLRGSAPPSATHTYKLFSRSLLTDAVLARVFTRFDGSGVTRRVWSAYPVFTAPERFAPFEVSLSTHAFED